MLLHYLRCNLDKGYASKSWLDFELKVLEFYDNIIEYLEGNIEMWGTLEQDLKKLQTSRDLSWGMRMALQYKTERVKILRGQKVILRLCRRVVEGAQDAIKNGSFNKLILDYLDDELGLENQESKETLQLKFQERRMINANYFKHVYNKVSENK